MENSPIESTDFEGCGEGQLETKDSASAVDIKPSVSAKVV